MADERAKFRSVKGPKIENERKIIVRLRDPYGHYIGEPVVVDDVDNMKFYQAVFTPDAEHYYRVELSHVTENKEK